MKALILAAISAALLTTTALAAVKPTPEEIAAAREIMSEQLLILQSIARDEQLLLIQNDSWTAIIRFDASVPNTEPVADEPVIELVAKDDLIDQ